MLRFLCLLGLVAVSVTANQCDSHANGCSIPFNMNYFYKDLFTPSCNKHDICYGCGAKFGVSRASCDNKFRQNMASACSTLRRRRSDDKRQINRAFSGYCLYTPA
nr:hypothetical protein BaRGS_014565 [Batillaria attramentaria]